MIYVAILMSQELIEEMVLHILNYLFFVNKYIHQVAGIEWNCNLLLIFGFRPGFHNLLTLETCIVALVQVLQDLQTSSSSSRSNYNGFGQLSLEQLNTGHLQIPRLSFRTGKMQGRNRQHRYHLPDPLSQLCHLKKHLVPSTLRSLNSSL